MLCVRLDNSEWIFGTYNLNVLTWLGLLLLCMIFYLCSYSDFFSSSLFNYRFPYCIRLYTWFTQRVIVADFWRLLILQCSALWLFQLYPIRAYGFPFPFIYGQPYQTLQSHLVLLPSDVLLVLFVVGGLSNLCIFHHNYKGWSNHSSWSCWIPLVIWPGRDISGELNHLGILSCCYIFCILSASPLT